MTGPEVLDVARDAILTLVIVSSPLLLIGLIVGVIISLFQALTQIQEMTLAFVPKILAIFVAMLIALPFMADHLQGHMVRLAARIAAGSLLACGSTFRSCPHWPRPSCWCSPASASW
jgi:flagellar biosynthetic protein FliQ